MILPRYQKTKIAGATFLAFDASGLVWLIAPNELAVMGVIATTTLTATTALCLYIAEKP